MFSFQGNSCESLDHHTSLLAAQQPVQNFEKGSSTRDVKLNLQKKGQVSFSSESKFGTVGNHK